MQLFTNMMGFFEELANDTSHLDEIMECSKQDYMKILEEHFHHQLVVKTT